MAVFGREMLGRQVLDRTGAVLGTLRDLQFDLNTGAISELVVEVEAGVNAASLPFDHHENTVHVPASSVARVASSIHLNR
jgi:sporulation protein YlmC with PRC-barrel domain